MVVIDAWLWGAIIILGILGGVIIGKWISKHFTPSHNDSSIYEQDGHATKLGEARAIRRRSQRARSHARNSYYGTEDFDDAFNLKVNEEEEGESGLRDDSD